eukprot:4788195-Prymnesium_polylepis.1
MLALIDTDGGDDVPDAGPPDLGHPQMRPAGPQSPPHPHGEPSKRIEPDLKDLELLLESNLNLFKNEEGEVTALHLDFQKVEAAANFGMAQYRAGHKKQASNAASILRAGFQQCISELNDEMWHMAKLALEASVQLLVELDRIKDAHKLLSHLLSVITGGQ